MNDRELYQLIRNASRKGDIPAPHGLSESILGRLPQVRFVIPGSWPGGRALLVAGLLAAAAAGGISWLEKGDTNIGPLPPLRLCQPAPAEFSPPPPTP